MDLPPPFENRKLICPWFLKKKAGARLPSWIRSNIIRSGNFLAKPSLIHIWRLLCPNSPFNWTFSLRNFSNATARMAGQALKIWYISVENIQRHWDRVMGADISIGNKLTLEVMLELGFGQAHDMIRSPTAELLIPVLQSYNFWMGIFFQCPSLANLPIDYIAKLFRVNSCQHRKWVSWSNKFLREILDDHGTKDKGRFALFLGAKDPMTKKPIPLEEIWAESFVWILAGQLSVLSIQSRLLSWRFDFQEPTILLSHWARYFSTWPNIPMSTSG